jgi:hypothetical protein
MKTKLGLCCATAVASSFLTFFLSRAASLPSQIKLENTRVKVSEVAYPPGVPRDRFTRPADEVIVFLDDCEYRRTDSQTGEKTVRKRRSGEVIWHNKGEDAPVLENLGAKPYRTLVIELK